MPALDGHSIYGFGPAEPTGEPAGIVTDGNYVLRRLDAETLVPRAEREVAGYRALRLRPAVPGDW